MCVTNNSEFLHSCGGCCDVGQVEFLTMIMFVRHSERKLHQKGAEASQSIPGDIRKQFLVHRLCRNGQQARFFPQATVC